MADETEETRAEQFEEQVGSVETDVDAGTREEAEESPSASEETITEEDPDEGTVADEEVEEPTREATEEPGNEDAGAGAPNEADAPSSPDAPDEPAVEAEGQLKADDETKDGAASAQQRIIGTAQRAAQVGTATVTEGVSAMRELSAARRAHATAFKELERLEKDVDQLGQQLDHRRDVEANYERIVEVQTQEIEDTARELEQARGRRASLESQLEGKNNELACLKKANEQKVAPSRKLMEEAKDALSRAERAHAEARRALKGAQAQANEAAANRDSKLQAAKRSADSASAKLARQQDQLTEVRRDPSAGAKGLSQASSAVAAALAQLENARENVARVTQETDQAVQIAQTHLYTQRKSLEEAEADLKAAQEHERRLRDAYDAKRAKTSELETGVTSKIDELKAAVKQAREDEAGARGRQDAARATLEEAHDIHAHPELTDELARRLEASRTQAGEQRTLVERLASEERMVRERTQHTRKIFYALVGIAVVIVLLVIALAFGR